MKLLLYILIGPSFFIAFSCTQKSQGNLPGKLATVTTITDSVKLHLDSLKDICQPGDLIVRLGDDFVSDRIRYLSATDHSYSHAGIIVVHDNKKMVCHIYPGDFINNADTIRYEQIDSFLNAGTILKCALYRYDLSDNEKINAVAELNKYHNEKIHFDKTYELQTDDRLYCSEMIYKMLKKVTNNRVVIEQSYIQENMQRLVSVYFKKYNFNKKIISNRKIIAIDNLYNNPHCRLLMKFTLKLIP